MLIGQARSGKTSLRKSLKKQKFDEKEPSTDGIERDPSYFSVTNEIMSSEETEEEQDVDSEVSFHKRIAKPMLDEFKEISKKETSLEMSERNLVSSNSSKLEESDAKKGILARAEENVADPSEEQPEKLFETNKESSDRKRFAVPKKTAACFEKIVNQSNIEDDGRIYFTLWDFGGQSVYYATHPIFLTGKAIYLLVYDTFSCTIHFHETQELKDMVILDPQWLIDLFRKVITVKPYEPVSDEEQYEELWEELENDGILNGKLIEIVWGSLVNNKTKESLIAIMEKFSLLCHLPSQDKEKQLYLVPSMLMSLSEDDANELLADAPICPLFVRFRHPSGSEIEYVQMPLGFFQRLVVKFLNWCIHQEFTPLYEDMYQNFAGFLFARKATQSYSVVIPLPFRLLFTEIQILQMTSRICPSVILC